MGRDGAISAALAVGVPSVLALLTGQPAPAPNVAAAAPVAGIGDVMPDFALPDLNGETVTTADLRGKRSMLLFWSPACGFCQQMLADLRR